MSLILIQSTDSRRIYQVEHSTISIEIDLDENTIFVHETWYDTEENEYLNSESIGQIRFIELEDGNHYITYMFLNDQKRKYLHKGIGRTALLFFKETVGNKIYAATDDGITRSDGSELTGDAPAFVHKMRAEGIIEPNSDSNDES